ncbi:hypothetical protein RKD27_000125 [Streptomyces sp. SAI-126]
MRQVLVPTYRISAGNCLKGAISWELSGSDWPSQPRHDSFEEGFVDVGPA